MLELPEVAARDERARQRSASCADAQVPLTEALYVLNLAAGADSEELAEELRLSKPEDFEYKETNLPRKPLEILGLKDDDVRVVFVDVIEQAEKHLDPMPKIAKGLVSMKDPEDVLLVHHPFDPIPLRDMFARRGFSSWAEERRPGDWYIYFGSMVVKPRFV